MQRQLRWRGAAALAAGFLVGSGSWACAQEPAPAGTPAAADPAAPQAVEAPADAAKSAAADATAKAPVGALGTLLAEGRIRCFPTVNSPFYEDTFPKGATLAVGRSENGFRQILLPIGPVGYVHKEFAVAGEDGKGATKAGKKVAFRNEPKSGRAPIALLDESNEMWIVGEHESWWRVRNPAAECWLPEAEVQVFEQPPETMVKAVAELTKVHRGEVEARIVAMQQAAERRRVEQQQLEQMRALQDLLATELKKPAHERKLQPIGGAVDTLIAQLAQESSLRGDAEELKRRITAQQWVVDATNVLVAEPVPAADVPDVGPGIVRDPLDRFQAVGFLRWERGLIGPGRYVVEKGGQPLYVVSCDSGRYDLALFIDMEVGITGPRRRPATESLRLLEAEKIEVLAAR